jgi:hypothetical protein
LCTGGTCPPPGPAGQLYTQTLRYCCRAEVSTNGSSSSILRLVPTRAVARARESRYRPRVGERRAREGRRATALALGESGRYRLALVRAGAPARARGGREGGESEARHWRGKSAGESGVARSNWSTCRDLIGPHVLAVATSRF